jgi:glycosyltransferase involved in cell wall biosynthesis
MATRILTPSEFSRRRLIRYYGVPADKVDVIPMAASPLFRPLDREAATERAASKFNLRRPFLLCVGDLQPRKNQDGLVEAFGELVRAYPEIKHDLVLAGKETWYSSNIHAVAQRTGVADRIRFVGFVADEDLVHLYNACEFFVFPSHYEGFGIPILEAMACGRAVACAGTSAMSEVAGPAALLFNPRSRRELVLAMRDLALECEMRQRLERLGETRASLFSWRHTATKTLQAYHQAVGEAARVPAYAASERAL